MFSGNNFTTYFADKEKDATTVFDFILLETSDNMLLETGDKVRKE